MIKQRYDLSEGETKADIETQKRYYDERWPTEKYINPLELKRAIAILQMIDRMAANNYQEKRILDLGCGRGWLSAILSQIGSTTAIDLSEEAIRQASQRFPDVSFRNGNLFEVLTERDTYDLVVSQEVIEHIEDQSAFVNLAADCLKLHGHFIFTTPNGWTQAHRTHKEHEAWGLQPIENWIDRKQISQLLASRFEIVQIESIILGFGSTGIFRVANSVKLRTLINFMKLGSIYEQLLRYFDFGLHLVVLAQRTL